MFAVPLPVEAVNHAQLAFLFISVIQYLSKRYIFGVRRVPNSMKKKSQPRPFRSRLFLLPLQQMGKRRYNPDEDSKQTSSGLYDFYSFLGHGYPGSHAPHAYFSIYTVYMPIRIGDDVSMPITFSSKITEYCLSSYSCS